MELARQGPQCRRRRGESQESMSIFAYMKSAEEGFQEGFLQILRWIHKLNPQNPIELFFHPSVKVDFEGLGDISIHPVSSLPSQSRGQLPEALAARVSETSSGLILSGPDSINGSPMGTFDGSPNALAFSTRLQVRPNEGKGKEKSSFTLIHKDPRPTEPRLDPAIPQLERGIFTGFVTIGHGERHAIWPIHSRGAEVAANLIKNLLHGKPPLPNAFLYPVTAMIEPTRRCNLACPMCPVGSHRAYKAHDMSLEQFQKVIEAMAPFLIHLFLHNYGESFLHRDIYHMIGCAKEQGIPDVNVSTNGHFLDPSRLIDSGLDEIMISIDGTTQETYARYRRGGNLEKVIENVRALNGEKKRRQTEKPLIELQFIIMRHNEDEIDGFRRLAAELGADRMRFKTFNVRMSGPEACEMGTEFLPTRTEYTRYQDNRGRILKRPLAENRCKWPWEWVVISSDGQVVPCCYDFNSSHSMGSVFEESFDDIWFGSKYNRFRKSILTRWRKIPLCIECPVPNRSDLSFERVEMTER